MASILQGAGQGADGGGRDKAVLIRKIFRNESLHRNIEWAIICILGKNCSSF